MTKNIAAYCFWLACVFSSALQADFYLDLANAAFTLTKQEVTYDPSYVRIKYPNGDVPANTGVCSDVIIRAYRQMGIDLQQKVHEDMRQNFAVYPQNWGLKTTDRNIDHRRVPNLMRFFTRNGIELAITNNANDYLPGDIVAWNLGGNITHIGIVSNHKNANSERYGYPQYWGRASFRRYTF